MALPTNVLPSTLPQQRIGFALHVLRTSTDELPPTLKARVSADVASCAADAWPSQAEPHRARPHRDNQVFGTIYTK